MKRQRGIRSRWPGCAKCVHTHTHTLQVTRSFCYCFAHLGHASCMDSMQGCVTVPGRTRRRGRQTQMQSDNVTSQRPSCIRAMDGWMDGWMDGCMDRRTPFGSQTVTRTGEQ
ncbi:unnamed protein product [Periconia digitata]|uniref:Uncharacterized protein n=1 Tax=Periconia digitata TaxID=1303443 RepID=A0A9W4XSV3_9PLEO|nr:unnamed protein product [Periconia digitata]